MATQGRIEQAEPTAGRRKAIAAGGAIALGVAAGMLGTRQTAEAHGTTHVDSATADPAIHGNNTDAGPGVLGTSASGAGVRADSTAGNGIRATSDQGHGVRAEHTSATAFGNAVLAINSGNGNGLVARAANGEALHGERLSGSGGDFPAITAVNGAGGPAVVAVRAPSATGFFGAVEALNSAVGPGVHGVGQNREGVVGERRADATGFFAAIFANNLAGGIGVHGRATSGPGVLGEAPGDSPGVLATSGVADAGGFHSDCGLALLALGKTVLRPPTAAEGLGTGVACAGPTLRVEGPTEIAGPISAPIGIGTILEKERVHAVADASAGTKSHIIVVLVGQPTKKSDDGEDEGDERSVAVSWIERAAGSFRIHLTAKTGLDTPFTYTVLNPS